MYQHQQVTNILIKNYKFFQLLGEGTSARVYRALHNITKVSYAIKVIPKQYLNSDPKLFQLVKTQIEILKSCNNINVIKCYDVFQSKISIFIVTELCRSNNLQQYLKQIKCIAQDEAVMYLKQIINGFKGLHDLGIMHRDFKLANVLINNNLCKIADLGFAKKMKFNELTYTKIGTKITMAPEVIEGKGYGFNADIWSLGVVFYHMLYGKYPYIGVNQISLLKNIKTNNVDFSGRKISSQAKDFIQKCLVYNPKLRINWQQVYKHALLNKPIFQILYSIYNPLPILHKNNQFYENNPYIKPSPQLSFLSQLVQQPLNSAKTKQLIQSRKGKRKPFIIQQFFFVFKNNQTTKGNDELSMDLREGQDVDLTSLKNNKNKGQIEKQNFGKQKQQIFYNYAQKYVQYFNKIASIFKFLRKQLINDWIQQINSYISIQSKKQGQQKLIQIQSLLYLILKKSYCQLLHYKKIITNNINMFKISNMWQQFIQSVYYTTMIQTLSANILKSYIILKQLQKYACLCQVEQIRIQARNQQYQQYTYYKIEAFYQKYIKNKIKYIYNFWRDKLVIDVNLYNFMENMLYYLIKDDRQKITPQEFNCKKQQIFNYGLARLDLIQRFQIFFNFL